MTHPKYPLQDEKSAALAAAVKRRGVRSDDIVRIIHQFNAKRDRLYPNWREEYELDFIVWNATQSNSTI